MKPTEQATEGAGNNYLLCFYNKKLQTTGRMFVCCHQHKIAQWIPDTCELRVVGRTAAYCDACENKRRSAPKLKKEVNANGSSPAF